MNGKRKVYGLVAEFDTAAQIFHAAEQCRDHGFKKWDVHTPYPVHGMDQAMGLGNSKVSLFSLIGGAIGLLTALVMIYGTSANYRLPQWLPEWMKWTYPMIVQGKPFFSFESSMPIFFELTVLFTAFFTVGSMLVLNLMPRWNHPVFNWDRFAKVTDDKFYVVIESRDPKFSETETRTFLEQLGGKEITLLHEEV